MCLTSLSYSFEYDKTSFKVFYYMRNHKVVSWDQSKLKTTRTHLIKDHSNVQMLKS